MPSAGWARQLRELREKEHLRREDLAELARVSPGTIKAYELGLRSPSRQFLVAILGALKADLHTRTEVLIGAGFAADSQTPAERLKNSWFTLDEAVQAVDRSPFPAHVSNEVLDVLFANSLMQRVWEADYSQPPRSAFERNFLSVLSHPHVATRLLNWEEALTEVLSMLRWSPTGPRVGRVLRVQARNVDRLATRHRRSITTSCGRGNDGRTTHQDRRRVEPD